MEKRDQEHKQASDSEDSAEEQQLRKSISNVTITIKFVGQHIPGQVAEEGESLDIPVWMRR
jgi:hypothetical protein